jgi:DNA mismatch endonuclease, patch repair protein
MSRIRGKNTKPEIILRKALCCCGLRYRVKNKLPGRPDIILPGRKTVVFVDGCFWHMCPRHFSMPENNRDFWKAKLKRNVARDREVNLALKKLGWKVVRFWEHDIADHLDRCVARMRKALRS